LKSLNLGPQVVPFERQFPDEVSLVTQEIARGLCVLSEVLIVRLGLPSLRVRDCPIIEPLGKILQQLIDLLELIFSDGSLAEKYPQIF
jgi:hypothetical protein